MNGWKVRVMSEKADEIGRSDTSPAKNSRCQEVSWSHPTSTTHDGRLLPARSKDTSTRIGVPVQ